MSWDKYLSTARLKGYSERNIETDTRNEFESDFGRVIFSPAIRRMHDKTQVFPLTADDNIHSRLTHSLEVMAIGYSLGIRLLEEKKFLEVSNIESQKALREIPVILKNICLVHDIGNPPFGHFGEEVIQNYFSKKFEENNFGLDQRQMEDFTKFDGNAQGFRVLTKLQVLEDSFGLNLTFATLASYLKYPNADEINKEYLRKKKRGVFQSEREYLYKVANGCGLIDSTGEYYRHPLSYLMEAADSICYLVMDIEDGFNKEWYSFEKIKQILGKLNGVDKIIERADKKTNEVSKMVKLRIELISYLVELAITNFINNYDSICKGSYNKELINEDINGVAPKLQEICNNEIFVKKEIQSLELTGDSVLSGLFDYFIKFLFHDNKAYRKRAVGLISKSILRAAFLENKQSIDSKFEDLNNYYKLRVIVDFITGMTDQYALNQYQRINGQKII